MSTAIALAPSGQSAGGATPTHDVPSQDQMPLPLAQRVPSGPSAIRPTWSGMGAVISRIPSTSTRRTRCSPQRGESIQTPPARAGVMSAMEPKAGSAASVNVRNDPLGGSNTVSPGHHDHRRPLVSATSPSNETG